MLGDSLGFRLVLPKGRLLEKSLTLAKLLCVSEVDGKRLSFKRDDLFVALAKQKDIPALIENGIFDAGMMCGEWVAECKDCRPHVVRAFETDWCDTRICLIGTSGAFESRPDGRPLSCVTEFPNVARKYLDDIGYRDTEIHVVSGSTEAFVPYLFDVAIDCVETGETVRANGLTVLDEIMCAKSSFCVRSSGRREETFSKYIKLIEACIND